MAISAATELTTTILPPPASRICGAAARIQFSAPKKFSSNMARTFSSGVLSAAPDMPMPALHTRISALP